MKKFISFVLLSLFFCVGVLQLNALSVKEKAAQKSIIEKLKNFGYECEIDSADNSVNFFSNDILYWINFKENGAAIRYSLFRKGIKLEDKNLSENEIQKYIEVANQMNSELPYKTYIDNNRVQFLYEVFAIQPFDFIKTLNEMLKSLQAAPKKFEDLLRNTTKNRNKSKKANKFKMITLVQMNEEYNSGLQIKDVNFRNVTADGKQISAYDENLRNGGSKRLQYVQPCVALEAPQNGRYYFTLEVKDPAGNLLISSPEDSVTMKVNEELTKKQKDLELGWFGSDDEDFWAPGKYIVIIKDEKGQELFETVFNVL